MKIRYFIFGFVSSLVITVASIFFMYKYFSTKIETSLKEEVDKETVHINFEVAKLPIDYTFQIKPFNNDKNINVDSSSGKLIFINFWATWCAPCIAEMPSMEILIKEEFFIKNYEFYFATLENDDKIESFLEKKAIGLPFYKYQLDTISEPIFNHKSIPTTYILDINHDLVYTITGSYNWNSELMNDFLKKVSAH